LAGCRIAAGRQVVAEVNDAALEKLLQPQRRRESERLASTLALIPPHPLPALANRLRLERI